MIDMMQKFPKSTLGLRNTWVNICYGSLDNVIIGRWPTIASLATIFFLSSIVATPGGDPIQKQNDCRLHLQIVNSYMTQFLPELDETSTEFIVQKVDDAIEAIRMGQPTNCGEHSLFGTTEPDNLLSTLNDLKMSIRDNCTRPSVEFLINVLELEASHDGRQFLHAFASKRLKECWHRHVRLVAKMISSGLRKMSAPIFETVHSVVNIIYESNKKRKPRQSGTLAIGANDESDMPMFNPETMYMPDTLAKLRTVEFDTVSQRYLIGGSLKWMFDQIHGKEPRTSLKRAKRLQEFKKFVNKILIEPCADVVSRLKIASEGSKQFEKHVKQTLGNALTSLIGRGDEFPELEHDLTVFKICRSVVRRTNLDNELVEVVK